MSKVTDLFAEYNKKYKKEIFTVGSQIEQCARIPFSSPRANYMLHGGLPRGRVVEFAGPESSGKTTTALDVVGQAQALFEKEWADEVEYLESQNKLTREQNIRLSDLKSTGPKRVFWIDVERTYDEEWADKFGVNNDILYMMNPGAQSAEEIFEKANNIIATGEIGLCVIDSLAAMVSDQELKNTLEESTYGGISRALTRFSKRVEVTCAETGCLLIGINQVRDNLSAGYGGPLMKTPGGKAWKHACSVRLMFRQGTLFDENYKDLPSNADDPAGHKVMIKLEKTKICTPNRKNGYYTLHYTDGVIAIRDLVDIAQKEGIIVQGGSWFKFVDPETGELECTEDENGNVEEIKVQGEVKIAPFLEEERNKPLLDKITAFVNKRIEE